MSCQGRCAVMVPLLRLINRRAHLTRMPGHVAAIHSTRVLAPSDMVRHRGARCGGIPRRSVCAHATCGSRGTGVFATNRPDAWSRSARSSHANPTYPRVLPSSGSPPATGQSSPRDAYEPDVRRADAERARRRPLPTIADASRPTDPGSQLVASTVASMIVGLDPSRLTTTPPPVSQRPPQRAHSSRIAAAASCEIRSGRLPAVK